MKRLGTGKHQRGRRKMGYYVNPTGKTKEQFLNENGTAVEPDFRWTDTPKGSLPVVFTNYGPVTTANIAFSEEELISLTDPLDGRLDEPPPRKIYTVPITDLVAHANSHDFNRLVEKGGVPA